VDEKLQIKDTQINGALSEYLDAVRLGSCPYIGLSQSRDLLRFYSFAEVTNGVLDESRFFVAAIAAVDKFRRDRRALDPVASQFLCHNLLLAQSRESEPSDAEKVLGWSHWLLKLLFSRCNIMFGKFWVGQRFLDRSGIAIPEPPVSFLSIRSGVVAKDPRYFFTYNEELRSAVASVDDSSNFDPISVLVAENWASLSHVELFEKVRAWALVAHPPSNPGISH
jgi:hypothetical protein